MGCTDDAEKYSLAVNLFRLDSAANHTGEDLNHLSSLEHSFLWQWIPSRS